MGLGCFVSTVVTRLILNRELFKELRAIARICLLCEFPNELRMYVRTLSELLLPKELRMCAVLKQYVKAYHILC